MTNISDMQDAPNDRRTFLRICGGAGALASGLSLLSACKDDVVGIEAVPQATPTSPVVGAPPAYTATDGDRYNFLLQMHYLLAAYFQRGVYGTTLTAAQTSGSGTAGGVTGGTQVTFTDPVVAATLREVADNTLARLLFLRRTLGSGVTAQPPINISGGQNSPFDDISLVPPAAGTPARTTFFNPYASETEFLLGAVVMLSIVAAVVNDLAWRATSTSRDTFGRLVGGAYLDNGIVRNAMFLRAAAEPRRLPAGQTSLFMRVAFMAGARDRLDGPQEFEKWLGEFTGGANGLTFNAAITPNDPNGMAFRRSAEQTLNISFATQNVATSGGFFPSGVNGLIRTSGNNLF